MLPFAAALIRQQDFWQPAYIVEQDLGPPPPFSAADYHDFRAAWYYRRDP